MSTIKMIRNDTAPAAAFTIVDENGDAVDISSSTVRFHMADSSGAVKVDAAATIVSGAAGTVSYAWAAADTDTAGWFTAEFEVTFPDSTIRTFPNPPNLFVLIRGDIN